MSGKLKKLHEIEINTCTRRPAKKNMQKNCNQFIGFSIKLSSQNTGNGFSDHQDFKFFMENPPRSPSGSPNRCCHDSWVFKKYSNFTYSKKRLDSLLEYYQWRLSPNQPRDLWSLSCGNDVLNFSCLYSVGDTHKYMKICFTFFKTICLKKEIWQKVRQGYMIIF